MISICSLAVCASLLGQSLPRRALLVSAGSLSGPTLAPYSLKGTANDVELMASLLIERFGFQPENINILGAPQIARKYGAQDLGAISTQKAVFDALQSCVVANRKSFAHNVFFFSGHGASSQEVQWLVAEDGGAIMDWELDQVFEKAVDSPLTVILDSCHAGGGTRGDLAASFGASKFLNVSLLKPPRLRPSIIKESKRANWPRYSELLATQESDPAFEIPIKRKDTGETRRQGLFTFGLYSSLIAKPDRNQLNQIVNEVNAFMSKFSSQLSLRGSTNPFAKLLGVEKLKPIQARGNNVPIGLLAGVENRSAQTAARKSLPRISSVDWLNTTLEVSGAGPSTWRMPPLKGFDGLIFWERKRSKGDSDGDERIAGSYSITLPSSGDVSQITIQSSSGLQTRIQAAGGSQRAREQVAEIQEALNLQQILKHWEIPEGPFGMELNSSFGLFPTIPLKERNGSMGETVDIQIKLQSPGFIRILSFEPDGTVAQLYPRSDRKQSQLAELSHKLVLQEPEGESLVVVVVGRDSMQDFFKKLNGVSAPEGAIVFRAALAPVIFNRLKSYASAENSDGGAANEVKSFVVKVKVGE